jgi:hypothetical protein
LTGLLLEVLREFTLLLSEVAFLAGFCLGFVTLVDFCFGCVVFLWGLDLLEDFTTKNTAKDNKYIIKCCEFCKYRLGRFNLYFGINSHVVLECNQNGCRFNFEGQSNS